jgi:cobalt-zinc-cadmium efflux system membrane fusion protein
VWVEANIYEKDLARIHRGQPVEIRVESYPDQSFRGKVEYVGDVLDAESRTARVRSVVSNPKGLLKPEMFATLQIATQKRKNAVYLPKDAVLDEDGKKVVFLSCMECPVDQKAGKTVCGTYDQRDVKVGTVRYDKVEVYGIQPGDLVITEGAYQLKTALGSGKLEAGCTDH